ncbi:SRPBCC family protein [Plantactinospora solaniradicis]|uniref:SRPBCC family protein n=1 Tax=Plantactinospora solaniradicis TaxID=1723736 RepID=A0ABW1KMH0_9ACTN
MPRTGSFRYSARARCELADAVRLLGDVERQAELHPLIVRVRSRPSGPGILRSQLVTDRLTWGPLRFRITYQTDTLRVGPEEVEMVARQWPRTTVHNHTRLTREPDGLVRVDVEITLSAPAPLFPYALRQARAAHLALAARLPAALER